ncbi:MAG TPA: LPS export ABC transporter ATP-binding protein [Gemmatimonadales bacterium]|nr:LPS export ABC transporter ATP-binding protein [Gemmatimonadales bacterium]
MNQPLWLAQFDGADPSLPLAVASLVAAADEDGRSSLTRLLLAYREGYLRVYRPAEGLGESVRAHVTTSVLPRLALDGWIEDTRPEWEEVRAAGAWWSDAVKDRDMVGAALLGVAHRARDLLAVEPPASSPSGSVLEGLDLTKSYRGRRVVDQVCLRLEQGEIVGLLGPNGAGKTTTFYLLTGLIRPEAGRVLLDGTDLTRAAMFRRARIGIGYLAQEPSVFRRMTVEENILAILETRKSNRTERQRSLERMLDELGIRHLRKVKAYALSGGERRRLEITRALVTEPRFMLLDEPFAGVDPIAVHDIQTIVAGLRHRGIGVLITDHNVEQTLDIVDRAYIMFEGKVQAAGTVRELVYDERVAERYLGPTLTTRLRARLEHAA